MNVPVLKPRAWMLVVAGAALVVAATSASAGAHLPTPTGLVWGGGGNIQPPPPAPTGLIWGGGRLELLLARLGLIRR